MGQRGRLLAIFTVWTMISLPAAGQEDAATIIFVSAPFSSAAESEFATAIKLAVSDLNDTGGLLNRTVKMQLGGTPATPDSAAVLARKIAATAPVLVVGETLSSLAMASSPIYARHAIPQFLPTATNPAVTELGIKTLFRMTGRDDSQGVLIADYLMARWGGKHIVFVTDGGTYSRDLIAFTQASLHTKSKSKSLTSEIAIAPETLDYTRSAQQLKAAAPDVVVLVLANSDTAVRFLKKLRVAGVTAPVIGSDTLGSHGFAEMAGADAESIAFTAMSNAGEMEANATFKARLAATGSTTSYSYNSYAAIQVWSEAVKQAGSFDGTKVAEIIHGRSFSTVLGRIAFSESGDLTGKASEWLMCRWKSGSIDCTDY